MTDDMTKRREIRFKEFCTDKMYLEGYLWFWLDGWDARDAIANEQLDELKQELANVDRAVLIAERRVHGDQADKMEASQEAAHYNWLDDQNEALKAQLKAKDAVIDVALKALSCYSEYCATTNRYPEIAKTTLEQIQKMRGGQDENI